MLETRRTMGRYLNLAVELAVLKARGAMDNEELTRPFLEKRGLLLPEEWDRLVPGDRHTTSYFWVLCYARKVRTQGLISDSDFFLLTEAVSECRGKANDLMDMLPNGSPYAYTQLVNFITKAFIFAIAVNAGFGMAIARSEVKMDNGAEPPWYWWLHHALVLVFCHACFQGVLELTHILHNPFLGDFLGVSHEEIMYGQIAKLTGWMSEGRCLPPHLHSGGPSQGGAEVSARL